MMMNIKNEQPKQDGTLFQKAKTLFQLDKYKQAEEVISTLILQDANNTEYLYFMALIKESRGLYAEQMNFLKKALTISPYSGELLIKIAFTPVSYTHLRAHET